MAATTATTGGRTQRQHEGDLVGCSAAGRTPGGCAVEIVDEDGYTTAHNLTFRDCRVRPVPSAGYA